MTLNVRVDNLRRSIRNDRMKQVYDQAIAAGWIARLRGSGHIRMTAPNDKRTFLTISVTASGARSALNVEAVLKRWLREQEVQIVSNEKIEGAIDRVELDQSLTEAGLKHGTVPQIPEREPEPMAQEHPLEQALAASDEVKCPECGRTFKRYGYGNHLAGHRRDAAAKANPVQPMDEKPDEKPNAGNGVLFSINEVITIANYGGSGGLIEVDKLRDGLQLVARLRGN